MEGSLEAAFEAAKESIWLPWQWLEAVEPEAEFFEVLTLEQEQRGHDVLERLRESHRRFAPIIRANAERLGDAAERSVVFCSARPWGSAHAAASYLGERFLHGVKTHFRSAIRIGLPIGDPDNLIELRALKDWLYAALNGNGWDDEWGNRPYQCLALMLDRERRGFIQQAELQAAARPSHRGPARILYYGGMTYGTDRADPVSVTERERRVLDAFLGCRSMDLPTLVNDTGCDEAPKVLKALRKKYRGIFASAIRLPGRASAGGYRVTIERAQ